MVTCVMNLVYVTTENFLFFCNKMTSEHMDKKYIVKRTICTEVELPFKNGMLQLQITILRIVRYRSSLSQHTKLTILTRAF